MVDHEGNIVFESVGKVRGAGLTINELRKNIENLIRPVLTPKTPFKSRLQNLIPRKH